MDFQDFQRVDRPTWRKYLFYIDLAVFAIFIISMILVTRHAFLGGLYYARNEHLVSTETLWLVVADTVFLVSSLCWIIYRFFRNQYLVLTRKY